MNFREHYDALMKLCEGDSPFYFVDQVRDTTVYRIFSYRLASYTEFLLPYARMCRGHMFELDADGNMVRCASMPPAKFFNMNENPITMDLDFSYCDRVLDKMDGSLISSYLMYDSEVFLKSKTSLNSDQTRAAMDLLNTSEYSPLKYFIKLMEWNGYTINLEYTAPNNRIVLPYQKPALTILNAVRSSEGELYGTMMGHDVLEVLVKHYGIPSMLVKNHAKDITDYPAFIESIKDMTDIEGYVIGIADGETVKIKTDWYCALHHAKDSINSPRRLFEVVVNEAHDDLRGVFPEDEYLLARIQEMEKIVQGIYAKIKINVEKFYNENASLDRKSYAILAQQTLPRLYFSLAMNLFLGKENDYKDWMLKHWKDFGIKDEPSED